MPTQRNSSSATFPEELPIVCSFLHHHCGPGTAAGHSSVEASTLFGIKNSTWTSPASQSSSSTRINSPTVSLGTCHLPGKCHHQEANSTPILNGHLFPRVSNTCLDFHLDFDELSLNLSFFLLLDELQSDLTRFHVLHLLKTLVNLCSSLLPFLFPLSSTEDKSCISSRI